MLLDLQCILLNIIFLLSFLKNVVEELAGFAGYVCGQREGKEEAAKVLIGPE